MLGRVLHIGVTVSDLERSCRFYGEILGLKPAGVLRMEGPATERLFAVPGIVADIAYFNGNDHLLCPPIELIQFNVPPSRGHGALTNLGISEICLETDDIEREYRRLSGLGVEFLSEPIPFDFRPDGFGLSKVVYFRDPDGTVLEMIQDVGDEKELT